MEDELFIPAEVCRMLDICKSTLYAWHRNGRLVPDEVTEDGRRFYSKKTLDDFQGKYERIKSSCAWSSRGIFKEVEK